MLYGSFAYISVHLIPNPYSYVVGFGPVVIVVGFGLFINIVDAVKPILIGFLNYFHDRRILSRVRSNKPTSRREIAETMSQMRGASGRLRYVRVLEADANELAQTLGGSDDVWPDSARPNFADDETSSRLARLDERWLGLGR